MSGPGVYLTFPTVFQPIPSPLPHALPPPVKERSFRSPFRIDKDLFNFALQPWIPITFASLYIVTVFALNSYNRSRDNKPWWIAKQRPFQWFVVVHNVLLALYSIATFAAMFRAIVHTWPEGGLLKNPNGAAGVADALCKLHGPRGLGDAATYNTTINIWEVKNTVIRLGYDGNPDPTDVGRLWNEGLAFWGWMFYTSKFYEVLDTMIILAKGKRSATLQTYHHAGAMLCMWAGIRYMSPPIWMFVFINSAIHGMMYTYFTLSALGYKVPQGLKRTLTSLQIAQFVFGASYAAAHLFVAYDIPISTPYYVLSTIEKAASSASSAVSAASTQAKEATSTISSLFASPTASGTMGALLKKFLLRAAGEEGMAERVRDRSTGNLVPFPPEPAQQLEKKMEHFNEEIYETRWHSDWTKVQCIDTSGEAFAIYLNLLYLAPLTWLFLRFFIRAYTQRGKPRSASQAAKQTKDSSIEAEKETERKFEEAGKKLEDEMQKQAPESTDELKKDAKDVYEQLKKDVEEMREGKYRGSRRVSDRVASFERQVKTAADKAKEKGKAMVNGNGSPRRGSPSKQGVDESAVEEEPEDTPAKKEAGEEDKADSPQQDQQSGEAPKQEDEEAEDEDKENQPPAHEGEGKENQPPADAGAGAGANNESAEKQEENMEDSSAVREGAGGEADDGDEGKNDSGEKPNQDDGKDSSAPTGAGANNEPEEKQDANAEDSHAIRPGPHDPDDSPNPQKDDDDRDDENTDAMGKSGSIIDLAKEKANDAQQEVQGGDEGEKKEEDTTKDAEPSGQQWKPPGATTSESLASGMSASVAPRTPSPSLSSSQQYSPSVPSSASSPSASSNERHAAFARRRTDSRELILHRPQGPASFSFQDSFGSNAGGSGSAFSSRTSSPVRSIRPGSSAGGESPQRTFVLRRAAGSSTSVAGLR